MESRQDFFIHLLSCAFEKKPLEYVPENMNWDKLFYSAKKHNMAHIFYEVIKGSNITPDEKFLKEYKSAIKKTAVFDGELTAITDAFKENNIPCLPLKGAVIKNFYPDIYMRTMSDLDILLFEKDRKKAKSLLLSLGYDIKYDEVFYEDVFIKPPLMNVELHFSLVSSDQTEYSYYENKISQLLDENNPHKNEDQYIFLIVHTAKHFRNGGIGVRAVADVYFFNKISLDCDYIKKELDELKLSQFENKIRKLAHAWFSNAELDDELSIIGEYILSSGAFGTNKNLVLSNKNVQAGKTKSFIIKRIFPSKNKLVTSYPSLKKCPFLLPFIWIVRLLKYFLFKKDKLKSDLKSVENIDKTSLENFEKLMIISGLKGDTE